MNSNNEFPKYIEQPNMFKEQEMAELEKEETTKAELEKAEAEKLNTTAEEIPPKPELTKSQEEEGGKYKWLESNGKDSGRWQLYFPSEKPYGSDWGNS